MRVSMNRRMMACLVAPLLLAASTHGTHTAGAGKAFGTCVACVSANHCASINGNGSTGCTFSKIDGCAEDFAICVCGNCGALAPDVPEERIERSTPFGKLALHPIGDGRFAAWNCSGELIALAERRAGGPVVDLPIEPFRQEYRYQTLLARAE